MKIFKLFFLLVTMMFYSISAFADGYGNISINLIGLSSKKVEIELNGIKFPEIYGTNMILAGKILHRTCEIRQCEGKIYFKDIISGQTLLALRFTYDANGSMLNEQLLSNDVTMRINRHPGHNVNTTNTELTLQDADKK